MNTKMTAREKQLIQLLQAKRREDPKGFSKYLPGVEELLPELPKRRFRSPFGLTERERSYHRDGLAEALARLEAGAIGAEKAVKALQHCAELIRDDNLPAIESRHAVMNQFIKLVIGKAPGSYKAKTTIPMGEDPNAVVLEQVSVIRGVYLNLGKSNRLVSISVHPGKVRERRELMKIVGIGTDPASDVAARHDDYLAMQYPHGAS